MAAVLTGTPVAVTWAAGIDPAGQSITIPADATAVYMFWTFFHGTAGSGLASATLNGNAPDQTFEIANGGTDLTATGVAVWYNPATGSQTLDPAWDIAPTEGPTTIVAFVKDGDTTAWRDADAAQGTGGGAVAVTLTTVAGDLVLALDQKYGATAPTAMGGSWTSAQTATNNSESCRLSYITAAGTTEVCTSQAVDYSTMVAISIPAGASGPATLSAPTPSGTIGTPTTATIGATTDQTSGTFYCVVDSAANLTGVTAAEIKAGQKAGGSAALAANNSAVSTTTPSAGVTGLTASTGYSYAVVQNNANGDSNVVTGTFTTSVAAPTLTDINGTEIFTSTSTGVVWTGTGFDGSTTATLTQGSTSVNQTVTANTSTTLTVTTVFDSGTPDLKYGAAQATVSNGVSSSPLSVTITPPDARSYVNITSLNPTSAYRITASPDLAVGDQIQVTSVTGGSISDVTLSADGTWSAAPGVTSFTVTIWDATDSTWGAAGTQSTTLTQVRVVGPFAAGPFASGPFGAPYFINPPNSGVTVNLTGVAGTVAAGSLNSSSTVSVTGQAASASAGVLAPSMTVGLSGSLLSLSVGSISVGVSNTLSGQSVSSASGTLSVNVTKALTGEVLTLSVGTITVTSGGDLTLALTGTAASSATGSLSVGIAKVLSGAAATASAGLLSVASGVSISGTQLNALAGQLAAALGISLSGAQALLSSGNVTVTTGGNVTLTLAGTSVSFAAGSLVPSVAKSLSGETASVSAGQLIANRSAALSGTQVDSAIGQLAAALGLSLTGAQALLSTGTVTISTGNNVTLTLTGTSISTAIGSIVAAHALTLAGQTVTAQAGLISVVGPAGPLPTVRFSLPEGMSASSNPYASCPGGDLQSGELGVIIGRFAWIDTVTQQVSNKWVAGQTLGFVGVVQASNRAMYTSSDGLLRIRAGYPVTLAAAGDFYARFSGGAIMGDRVYAAIIDGALISGSSPDGVPTQWAVARGAGPGELAVISTYG